MYKDIDNNNFDHVNGMRLDTNLKIFEIVDTQIDIDDSDISIKVKQYEGTLRDITEQVVTQLVVEWKNIKRLLDQLKLNKVLECKLQVIRKFAYTTFFVSFTSSRSYSK